MEATNTTPRRHYTNCRICGQEMRRPIVVTYGLVLCKTHKRQLATRRRTGVSTAQLSADWGDRLANWRERPAELEQETKKIKGATPLFFSRKDGEWLLFRRGYIVWATGREIFRGIASLLTLGKIKPSQSSAVLRPKKHRKAQSARRLPRMGDFLALNVQTGELRRFVDVDEQEVLDDLQGKRPVPGHAESAAFWGNPAPTGRRERLAEQFRQQVFGPGHRLLIAQFVGFVPFPLYGPIDNPLGLVLTSTGWSGRSSDDIGSVDLSFRSPRFPDTSVGHNMTLITSRAHQHGIYQPPDNDERFIHHLDASIFQSYRLNDSQREQAGQPEIWRGELLIDTETFSGEIRSWSQPYQLARFTLKNEQTILSGHTCGPSRDELLQLLASLKVLNQHEETLAQYQRELDETRA